ncbi:chromosome segregation protein SMC [Marinibactrum halimedae]|uniref:Chromosome partition protein Smc n=1 Tax=Marinibactrum halimedae TaxID=1444977 RepID=A0AA37T8B3_9GAMM|nr:chromosome segregation protein SMC [Marinibactrum halimedae]MCD9459414.1 chromosome segregation protein SMC [Marinibactrum halimedae]GLS27519.1 chromosome partition protein Smc [Marinibactrum halimedae]
MRLKCIKLAGFKSFVDPTTAYFPSNLGAVVGPNGCGKSNIIDAVRWVMGESSAKNLRGESMTDVIFNGSGGRKPVGQASIELVFDNSDGTIVGEYASFNEISVRRKVTRDGQNNYYLNGTKCRRRDITDLFLGTGLGPRSYAIIEQGMISKLIEAKPEDLRVYIEEAAGISKYKERRRDTENRMRRTQENLERLTDIREELDRQLNRLERQAQAAKRYTELKAEERQNKALLQALRYQALDQKSSETKATITDLELKVEAMVTSQVSANTEVERLRGEYTDAGDRYNEVQGRFYSLGADIARIEQTIQHSQERSRQLQADLDQTERDYKEAQDVLGLDQEKSENFEAELMEIEPELELLTESEEGSSEALLTAEERLQVWQSKWDEFNQRASTPRQQAEVQQSRIQHLEQVQTRLNERIERLRTEKDSLSAGEAEEEIELLNESLAELDLTAEEKRERLEALNDQVEAEQQRLESTRTELDTIKEQLQTQRGRHASLEALQQAALGDQGDSVIEWMTGNNLEANPQLAEQLQVEERWQTAVETVLGDHLQAVCVDAFDTVAETIEQLEQGQVVLFDSLNSSSNSSTNENAVAQGARPLLACINASGSVESLLDGIYGVASLSEALALRSTLKPHESVVTQDGIWLGSGWLRVTKGDDAAGGVIARQQELEALGQSITDNQALLEAQSEVFDALKVSMKEAEQQRETLRSELDQDSRRRSEVSAELSAKKAKIEQILMRRSRADEEIGESMRQQAQEAESLAEARAILEEAIEAMEKDTQDRDALLAERDRCRAEVDNARNRARQDKDRAHQLAMRYQSVKTQLESIRTNISRATEQVTRLTERRAMLQDSLAEHREPGEDHKLELEALLQKRLSVEEELVKARSLVEEIEQKMRELEQSRGKVEQELQGVRGQLEQARLAAKEFETRRANLLEQLQEENFELKSVLSELTEEMTEAGLVESLEKIEQRISRLGAINLAAIDEFQSESERKEYLDRQDGDLREALEMLENAIRKIDKETRTRFKETFDQVNSGLQELFPKVFGGGHAYLELTGDDLLDTGIAIMARPPGKRNSTIHLLSGGEKALTAIALVFSIFRLNPAPFCMLDEVDAPLDDANVGRYARMVEEMSEQVQFIYITHNKGAMEMAHHLLGVTMHEPGVSRLVTVDVEEAAELAAS